MFATVVPGLARVVRSALAEVPGVTVEDQGFDGRSDILVFSVARGHRGAVLGLGLTEDVFVEVGRTLRADGDRAPWIAGRLWRPERVGRALSVWSDVVRPLSGVMTYRVIARVLQERSFLRTDLRRQLTDVIAHDRPKWRVEDPAAIEVWVTEYRAGRFLAGLRLSDATMRQHAGRAIERPGALRPTVAAAMVHLAGSPPGVLLDPCCGSGTILSEALSLGWKAIGVDIDSSAVDIAAANAPAASVSAGDVRRLTLPDASVDACVSNLPFGKQYELEGDASSWLREALSEMARVTRAGGRVVLLVPDMPRTIDGLALRERHELRLLGLRTTLWSFDRL